MSNYSITAPCGQTVTAATQVELGMNYSAHISSCNSEACKKASGR